MKYKLIVFLSFVFTCGVFTHSNAQLYTLDIDKSDVARKTKFTNNQRTEEDRTLNLPFWDDFSFSQLVPTDSLWKVGDNVEVSAGAGLNAPTINVASFNGIKIDGSPYSFNSFENGDTDTLTSHFIDLSNLTTGEKNTVYLSFFYQKQGNGELPDDNDGIRVEFMNRDSIWVSGFEPDSLTGANINDTEFQQVIMQVQGDEFFHEEFRFQIISTGRQTGPYDTWNIDYVYLDKGRNSNDLTYPDRSFVLLPSSPWKTYTALPIKHFLENKNTSVSTITSHYKSLDAGDVSNYTLEGHVSFTRADTVASYVDIIELDNPTVSSQTDIIFTTNNTLDVSAMTDNITEAQVILKLHSDTGETVGTSINTLINDTIYATYYLRDYFAYDDGTAEKAAGVNSIGNQIAYQFAYTKTTSKDSILLGVDMYFPKSIGHDQFNKSIKLKVWNSNNGLPNEVIYEQTSIIPKIDTLNKFVRYNFAQELNIADTFYIGWEQLTIDRVYVGLDKNTNSGSRIYYNTIGDWLKNDGDIVGSLMMRPVFGEIDQTDPGPITGIIDDQLLNIKVYPNPSQQYCHITGVTSADIKIYDLNGRQIGLPMIKNTEVISLDFGNIPNGIYLIKFIDKQYIRTEKFILGK